jgi:hypothetical protein
VVENKRSNFSGVKPSWMRFLTMAAAHGIIRNRDFREVYVRISVKEILTMARKANKQTNNTPVTEYGLCIYGVGSGS